MSLTIVRRAFAESWMLLMYSRCSLFRFGSSPSSSAMPITPWNSQYSPGKALARLDLQLLGSSAHETSAEVSHNLHIQSQKKPTFARNWLFILFESFAACSSIIRRALSISSAALAFISVTSIDKPRTPLSTGFRLPSVAFCSKSATTRVRYTLPLTTSSDWATSTAPERTSRMFFSYPMELYQ